MNIRNETTTTSLMIYHKVHNFVMWLFHAPLFHLYLYGPRMGNIGFWQGVEDYEICHELTQVPSEHWKQNPLTCNDLIHSHFRSFFVIFTFCFYLYLVYCVMRCLSFLGTLLIYRMSVQRRQFLIETVYR
jgi:hypothetical protein